MGNGMEKSLMNIIRIIAIGQIGVGKSAILGEIEIALKEIGVDVRYSDPVAAQVEKNLTHADWMETIERVKPVVILEEVIGYPDGP